MAFREDIKQEIDSYIRGHLASEQWHKDFFSFISDESLSERLAEEFMSVRYIYKFLEGMQVDGFLQTAQIKLQILFYASIYEAIIHHILFDVMKDHHEVNNLLTTEKYNRISVSKEFDNLTHDGKEILTMYKTIGRRDVTKVRFDEKVKVFVKLGFITSDLGDELIDIYEIRNAIHIHAELRKGIQYEMEKSTVAYRRMQVFKEQVVRKLQELGQTQR
jgi:hypothetical protein